MAVPAWFTIPFLLPGVGLSEGVYMRSERLLSFANYLQGKDGGDLK